MEAPGKQETVAKRIHEIALTKPGAVALYTKDEADTYRPTTFRDLWDSVRELGCAFMDMGIARQSHVGIMSDNRREWT